jgi:hypothetical protein
MNQMNATAKTETEISAEALAHLGDGRIAYVKTVRSEDVRAMFPQAQMPQRPPLPMPGARSSRR